VASRGSSTMANPDAAPLRRSLVAGALAGAVEATCTCPVETIKTRVQLARASATPQQARMLARGQLVQLSNPVLKATQTNMLLVGRDIVRAEGTLALWKGLRPLVGGVMIKKALRFGSFAWWKGAVTGGHGGPLSVGQSLLGGLFAGTIETVAIVTPSEVVKTRMQANTAVVRSSLVRAKVGSIAHVTGQIVRSEGPGALWNGLLPTWVRQSSNQAVRFAVVGEVAQRLKARDADDSKQGWHGFAAGGIAGGSSVLLNNPADVVKTRMMNQRNDLTSALSGDGNTRPTTSHYRGSFDCLCRVARGEGVAALWRGSFIRICRLVPGQAITFGAFGYFSDALETAGL